MKTLALLASGQLAAAFHAEVRADGSIERLLRADDGSHLRQSLEDRAGTADPDSVECAREAGNCTCDGVVLYGREGAWQQLRVEGSVLCTASLFDSTPAPAGQSNLCRCFPLTWCQKNNVDGFRLDTAHRRRKNLGTAGINLHQRRRWCGWGPRDCSWSDWSSWSECEGGTGCDESGSSQRKRRKETMAENGGKCQDLPSAETKKCNWSGCQHQEAEKGATHILSSDKVLNETQAQARITAVLQRLQTLGSSEASEKVKARAMAMAQKSILTPLNLAKMAAQELVDAMPQTPKEALHSGAVSVAKVALEGTLAAAKQAQQIAEDLGLDGEVTIFKRTTTVNPMSQAHST